MSQAKKFGTFAGVFTPALLTILGVIMYLRMGWVVGSAGLFGTVLIILFAHVISVTTGLSISSLATDKKVGAGGVYYVLSRSLGLPMGGALGMTLFVATALSISLYMVGFAEIFNEKFHFGFELAADGKSWIESANYTNQLRITGSIGLFLLTIIALISTSSALKAQFFILAAILLSLLSIFFGDPSNTGPIVDSIPSSVAGPALIFAIFFPAVTGFTAGVAMSGDLKDPKRSIPAGTLGAIAAGLVIYLMLGIFIYFTLGAETLLSNPRALFEMALIPILVYIGVWGATLSSALSGILGGPRILQAMSADKITPSLFATGVGKGNEPRNAIYLTVFIAEIGVLIGDLNAIAEVVSMFYLSAYGFINLAFFLESWASSDFNPTFKVRKWVGLLGFLFTVIIMSQLNLLAMIVAFVIIGGIFYFLSKRQVALGTGDIWQSVWSTIVKKGLKRMESKKDHTRNWKPNTLLFSAGTQHRTKMIEFSKAVSGQTGIITNFDLIENENATVLFPKSKEAVKDEELDKYGIFGRKLEVQNTFRGIESIACTFGFSGIEPNTVLMAWPGETEHPIWFTQMTQKLIELDYNVLYLDYDVRWGFRKQENIDLWWRGVSNNSELMLLLAKFIVSSPNWSQASIRVLLVNDTNVDNKVIENRIQYVLDQYRIDANIKIVNNQIDQKPLYELMKIHSSEADLVFVGIPPIHDNEVKSFVETTNNLVRTIGTTLLVKASTHFAETDLKLRQIELKTETERIDEALVIPLDKCRDEAFNEVMAKYDAQLNNIVRDLTENSVQRIENYHHRIFSQVIDLMDNFLDDVSSNDALEVLHDKMNSALVSVESILIDAIENQLGVVAEEFKKDVTLYLNHKEDFINHLPASIVVSSVLNGNQELVPAKRKVKFRMAVQRIWYSEGISEANDQFLEFGYQNLILLHQTKNLLHNIVWDFLTAIRKSKDLEPIIHELKQKLDAALAEIDQDALNLSANFYKRIRNKERENINQLNEIILEKKYVQVLASKYMPTGPALIQQLRKEMLAFPIFWKQNITLFTKNLIGDVQLMRLSASIQAFADDTENFIQTNYLKGFFSNVVHLKGTIETIDAAIKANDEKTILNADVFLAEEISLNSEVVVNRLLASIQIALQQVPSEVELLTSESINAIRDRQGKSIKTANIGLRDIAEFLVKREFEDRINEHIQLLYDQLKRAIGKMINASNIIQVGIDNFATTENSEVLFEGLKNAKREVEESENQIVTARDAFIIELRDRKIALKKELDIHQIIEQIDSLSQYVQQQKRRKGIKETLQGANAVVGGRVRTALDYFAQKQQDITASTYKRKYSNSLSEQGILADFVEAVSPKVELPFYYHQLYSSISFSESKEVENRRFEIDQIQVALRRIDEGASGAILILGSASSGKTFLTTHVANVMLKGRSYQIQPPINKTRKKEDLLRALQRTTACKEPLIALMKQVPAKSTFVFQDLEKWWIKSKDGDILLNEITKLISEFGGQHYFVLNANIHSYLLMSQQSSIQSVISRSVILAPLTVSQIKDAIWSRHKTGGLTAHFNGISEKHLSPSKLTKQLNRYHSVSNGVVGMALTQWISTIDKKKDNDLFITSPKRIEFPALRRPELRNMLYQIFLHYGLTKDELYRVYGKDEKNWIDRSCEILIASGVVKVNEREALYINSTAKPYIENWLNELGFIK